MKKIAVMGARGFVGHNLTEHLKNNQLYQSGGKP